MGITRIFVSMDFIKLNDIKYSKDFVFYSKPNDVEDSSKVILEVLELLKRNDSFLINRVNLGSEYIKHNFQPSNRAKAYLEIINSYEQ